VFLFYPLSFIYLYISIYISNIFEELFLFKNFLFIQNYIFLCLVYYFNFPPIPMLSMQTCAYGGMQVIQLLFCGLAATMLQCNIEVFSGCTTLVEVTLRWWGFQRGGVEE
jgi:hypothetical protein